MPLTRYGLREWLTITLVACAIAAGFVWLRWWLPVGLTGVAWFALAMFFRDPIRRVPTDLKVGTMLSPADGTISAIERVDHHEATGGPAVIVRIFLSVLNVHVNRAPFDGRVAAVRYVPGKFLDARSTESARVNESSLLTLEIGSETIGVKQISGLIARRIVCAVGVGEHLRRGQRFGMIKFGSTTELILPRPDDVEVLVEVGQRVRGGLTSLATLEQAAPVEP